MPNSATRLKPMLKLAGFSRPWNEPFSDLLACLVYDDCHYKHTLQLKQKDTSKTVTALSSFLFCFFFLSLLSGLLLNLFPRVFLGQFYTASRRLDNPRRNASIPAAGFSDGLSTSGRPARKTSGFLRALKRFA